MLDRADSCRPERRSALIAHELSRLNIDIAALSEVRFSGKAASKNTAPVTPSTGQANRKPRDAYQVLASWSGTPLPPSLKISQRVIPTASSPCAYRSGTSNMPRSSVCTPRHSKQSLQRRTGFILTCAASYKAPLLTTRSYSLATSTPE